MQATATEMARPGRWWCPLSHSKRGEAAQQYKGLSHRMVVIRATISSARVTKAWLPRAEGSNTTPGNP